MRRQCQALPLPARRVAALVAEMNLRRHRQVGPTYYFARPYSGCLSIHPYISLSVFLISRPRAGGGDTVEWANQVTLFGGWSFHSAQCIICR